MTKIEAPLIQSLSRENAREMKLLLKRKRQFEKRLAKNPDELLRIVTKTVLRRGGR